MNNHCWRNSRPGVKDDDEKTWPKLPHPTSQEKHNIKTILRPRISTTYHDLAGNSQDANFQECLNAVEYPKLGEIVLKRKHSSVESNQVEIHEDFVDSDARRIRKHRSTDLIHINLQKTLEKQRWPLLLQSEHPTKITVDICKLNVNMSVASPLDGRWMLSKTKRRPMLIIKKKKPSRLKWLILYERMSRKHQFNESRPQINNVNAEDIPEINFNRLKINSGARDDPELVNKMAALSCIGTNYRDNSKINIVEDTVTFHPDLHKKMECLSIESTNGCKFHGDTSEDDQSICINDESIGCEIINAAVGLKICDETGEFTDNIVIKEEPGRINFSNKFREYCTNTVTPDLKKHLAELLAEISRLQKKIYERDSVKGKCKRRYYAGIKEVQKHIELKKIKFVVIAPDLEKVKIKGGLDDTISKFIGICKRYEVPYCFGLNRRKLGYYIHGKGFVSCIGIANYSGAEEKLKNVLLEVVEARNAFTRLISEEAKTIDVDKLLPQEDLILSEIVNAYLKILAINS